MSESAFEKPNLTPLVAAYTSAERRANVATQLRDRFGRWVEMGRGFKFKYRSGGQVRTTTGKFVGAVPNRPGYGMIYLQNDPNLGSVVIEVNMQAGEQVLATLSADDLRKAGVTKRGHDVNGNPIGEVLDEDIESVSNMPMYEPTELDKRIARGQLLDEERAAILQNRKSAPPYESRNVVAEADATQEDLGEGYDKLQEALGREVPQEPSAPEPTPAEDVEFDRERAKTDLEYARGYEWGLDERLYGDSNTARYSEDNMPPQWSESFREGYLKASKKGEALRDQMEEWLRDDGQEPGAADFRWEMEQLDEARDAVGASELFREVSDLANPSPARVTPPTPAPRPAQDDNILNQWVVNPETGETMSSLALSRYFKNRKIIPSSIDSVSKDPEVKRSEKNLRDIRDGFNPSRVRDNRAELEKARRALEEAQRAYDEAKARALGKISDEELSEAITDIESRLEKTALSEPRELETDANGSPENLKIESFKEDAELARAEAEKRGLEVPKGRESLKEALRPYDNENGELAALVDSGATSGEILDWMDKNSFLWQARGEEVATAWAVPAPSEEQRAAWAEFDRLRSYLRGYQESPDGSIIEAQDYPAGSIATRDITYWDDRRGGRWLTRTERWNRTENGRWLPEGADPSSEDEKVDSLGDGPTDNPNIQYGAWRIVLPQGQAAPATPPQGPPKGPDSDGISPPEGPKDPADMTLSELAREMEAPLDLTVPEGAIGSLSRFNAVTQEFYSRGGYTALAAERAHDDWLAKLAAYNAGVDDIDLQDWVSAAESIKESEEAEPLSDPAGDVDFDNFTDEPDAVVGESSSLADLVSDALSDDDSKVAQKLKEDASNLKDSANQKNGPSLMKNIRKVVTSIKDFFSQNGGDDESPVGRALNDARDGLTELRDRNKNRETFDPDSEKSSSFTAEELSELSANETPDGVDPRFFEDLVTPDALFDGLPLNTQQKELATALLKGKKAAIDGMIAARLTNDNEKYELQYTLALAYADKIRALASDVRLRGDQADVFGGIENRIQGLRIIGGSVVKGPGSDDSGREVILKAKAVFIGKSGKPFLLTWNYDRVGARDKTLIVSEIKPDGTLAQAGFQMLGNPAGGWHVDGNNNRARYDYRYARGARPVTPGMLRVNEDYRGDGLGGILTLMSDYVVAAAGKTFQHSNHLLVDGNRNSKITNSHDPSKHHRSQREFLMQTRGSKVINWLRDIGWISAGNSPLPENLWAASPRRPFSAFNEPLGARESWPTEGPVFHLQALLRAHADGFRNILKYNPQAADNLQIPEVYKNFIRKNRVFDSSDFDILKVFEDLAFEGGIGKEEAVRRLKAIRDSIQVSQNNDYSNLVGLGRVDMAQSSRELVDFLDQLIEKIDSEEFTDADKLPVRSVSPLDEIRQVDVPALDSTPDQKYNLADEILDIAQEVAQETLGLDITPIQSDLPPAMPVGADPGFDANRFILVGISDRYIAEASPNAPELRPLTKIRRRATYDQNGQVELRLGEPGSYNLDDRYDSPAAIARNFGPNGLRHAYSALISGRVTNGSRSIELRYGDGNFIQAGHAILRDALILQGQDPDQIIDSLTSAQRDNPLDVREYREPVRQVATNRVGNATETIYEVPGDGTRFTVVQYDAPQKGTGIYAAIRNDNGFLLGVARRIPDGRFGAYYNRDPENSFNTEGDFNGPMPPNMFVVGGGFKDSQGEALRALNDNFVAQAGVDGEFFPEQASEPAPVQLAVVRDESDNGLRVITVGTGIDGRNYRIYVNDSNPEQPYLNLSFEENVPGSAVPSIRNLEIYANVSFNSDDGSRSISINGDSYQNLGNEVLPTRFSNMEEAIEAIGEYIAIREGKNVNPISGAAVLTSDDITQNSNPVDIIDTNVSDANGDVITGRVQSPRGGIIDVAAVNATTSLNENGEPITPYHHIGQSNAGASSMVTLNGTPGNYVVSYYDRTGENVAPTVTSSEFSTYAEAIEFYKQKAAERGFGDISNVTYIPTREAPAQQAPEAPQASQNSREKLSDEQNAVVDRILDPVVRERVRDILAEVNGDPIDISGWTPRGTQGMVSGVNDTQIYRDPEGNLWVVKKLGSASNTRAKLGIDNEIFNMAMYRAMGIPAGAPRRVFLNANNNYIASPLIPNENAAPGVRLETPIRRFIREAYENNDLEALAKIRRGLPLDIIMSNPDLVFHSNNMIVGDDGLIYRIDGGGGMGYSPVVAGERVGGAHRNFRDLMGFWRGLVDPGRPNYELFGQPGSPLAFFEPDNELSRRFVREAFANLSDEAIDAMVQIYRNPEAREESRTLIKARRDAMLEYYGVDRQAPSVPEAPQAPSVPEAPQAPQTPEAPQAPQQEVGPELQNVQEVAPNLPQAQRVLIDLNNTQIVRNAVKQAYPNHTELPNGDIVIAERTYRTRTRGAGTIFKYQVVVHKTKNDSFVSYVRQIQVDENGNQIGDTTTAARFTDLAHSAEVTLARARALIQGNSPGKGINGTNPNNWFNNSGDREQEVNDSEFNIPVPPRFADEGPAVSNIGNTGIPKTGNATLDALIEALGNEISLVPEGRERDAYVQNLLNNWGPNAQGLLTKAQLEDVIERIVANRETPGVNMVPYPSRDGVTIVRRGDKVRHYWQGRTKTGRVMGRSRIRYRKPNGQYTYEDVVYVKFDGENNWKTITTKNLEVLSRVDGSAPLPYDIRQNRDASPKPTAKEIKEAQQLKWQSGSDGVAYLGGSGKNSEEIAANAKAYMQILPIFNGRTVVYYGYKDKDGKWITGTRPLSTNETASDIRNLIIEAMAGRIDL